MPDEQTPGAVAEGANPSGPTVASEVTAPIDLSKIDLSTLPQYREVESKLQRRIAAAENAAREAEARAQRVELENMTNSLRAEGLDENAIARSTQALRNQVAQLEAQKVQLVGQRIQEKGRSAGLTDEQIRRVPIGSSPEEYERAMEIAVAAATAEREKRELEAKLTQYEKAAKDVATQDRRASGAERLAGGEPEPHLSDQESLRKERAERISKARSSHEVIQIRQEMRLRGYKET